MGSLRVVRPFFDACFRACYHHDKPLEIVGFQRRNRIMTIKNNKDFWAGALFMLFGIGAAVVAQENELGTLSRMEPGFFPTASGLILAFLGAVISIRALVGSVNNEPNGPITKVQWSVLIFILGSVALFALSLLTVGLLGSIAILVVTSSFAAGKVGIRWKEVSVLTVFLAVLCWVVFGYGIGLQVPVWPTFL